MSKGSDLLVAALENEGVERIFGVPGEENLDVVESLRDSTIKLILTRHEQAAAFMAATYGRLTGKPGVCITTLGPGALNLTTGAAYAYLGAMPMVMITGQKAIMSSRQARFQIVDVVSAFKPLTKLSRQIASAASIPTIVRDAFRVAMQERPGPVLLELPADVAGEEGPDLLPIPLHSIETPVAHRVALDRAADIILAAKRPLIMLGAAASRPRSTSGLAGFVRRTQIPFFTTQMGKGTVPSGANLYMGTAALSERDYVHEAVDQADGGRGLAFAGGGRADRGDQDQLAVPASGLDILDEFHADLGLGPAIGLDRLRRNAVDVEHRRARAVRRGEIHRAVPVDQDQDPLRPQATGIDRRGPAVIVALAESAGIVDRLLGSAVEGKVLQEGAQGQGPALRDRV